MHLKLETRVNSNFIDMQYTTNGIIGTFKEKQFPDITEVSKLSNFKISVPSLLCQVLVHDGGGPVGHGDVRINVVVQLLAEILPAICFIRQDNNAVI